MKSISLFLSLLVLTLSWAQWPGSEIDFGKYDKKFGQELIIKNPGGRNYYSLGNAKSIDISNAKVHHSRVLKGDTTSMSINGYYVEYIPARKAGGHPDYVYYSDYVSNKDWNLFRKYVIDSTARRILSLENDSWVVPTFDEIDGDVYEMERSEWNLNWKQNVNYKHEVGNYNFYMLSRMFYPPSERHNWKRLIDERKVRYDYYWVDIPALKKDNTTPRYDNPKGQAQAIRGHIDRSQFIIREICSLYRDSTLWVTDSSSIHFGNVEDGLVCYYNWHEAFEEKPVCGISEPQARGYLNWLEWNHNEFLIREGIPYQVKYELPSVDLGFQTQEIEVPSFDLENWKITNEAYKEFVDYVRDSIARKMLSEEFAIENYLKPTYDDELSELDPSEWFLDWKGDKIDWNRKTGTKKFKNWKGEKVKPFYGVLASMFYPPAIGDSSLIDKRKLFYEYYFYDFKSASVSLAHEEARYYYPEYTGGKKQLESTNLDCFHGNEGFRGKSLDLSYINSRFEATDVFAHENRSQFIIKDMLNVYPAVNHRYFNKRCSLDCNWWGEVEPEDDCKYFDCDMCPQPEDWNHWELHPPKEYDFDSQPNELVQISYLQFRAYWWWYNKERRGKVEGNPVIADYIPSEEEFEKLWKGEKVIHPKEVHQLPTPTFNYVLKFYKIGSPNY